MAYVDHLGDVWKVTMAQTTGTGQVQLMSVHYEITVAGVTDSRLSLLSNTDTLFNTFLQPYVANPCHYYGSKCSPVKTAFSYAPAITRPNVAGTAGAKMLPSQVRPVIKWKTDFVGRGYRGRMYAFTPEATAIGTAELPSAGLIGALTNFAAAIATGTIQAGTTWTPVIWHKVGPHTPVAFSTPITSGAASGLWGTQRRSGDYGRPNTAAPW